MSFPRQTAEIILRVADLLVVTPEPVPDPVALPEEDLNWRNTEWYSADGRITLLKDLDDDHLRNIIFYQQRETGYTLGKASVTPNEVVRHNDVRVQHQSSFDIMRREADYRKLSWI